VIFIFKKYIAGKNINSVINKVKLLNKKGINCIVNYLGENIKDTKNINKIAAEYITLLGYLNELHEKKLYKIAAEYTTLLGHLNKLHEKKLCNNSISLKISQFGGVRHDKLIKNLSTVVTCANSYGIFVWIDMEHYHDIQTTINIYNELKNRLDNINTLKGTQIRDSKIGVALQANAIQKSIKDINNISCVRICKGAYTGPVYTNDYDSINLSFTKLMWKQFTKKGKPFFAIATHDEKLIQNAINMSEICEHKNFEFQMLFGIRKDMQQCLVDLGYNVSVYVPYGTLYNTIHYMTRRCLEKKRLIKLGLLNLFR